MRRPARATALVTLALLAACTPSPSPAPVDHPSGSGSPRPSASTIPAIPAAAQQFAPLPGDDTGSSDWIASMASSAGRVVATGGYVGWRGLPTFRYSDDGGQTWELGALSAAAKASTPINSTESADLVVAPSAIKRWLALGVDDTAVAWTSSDGKTWDRRPIASSQIRETDGLAHLVAIPGGYLAVGSRNAGATSLPMAWTSTDGLSWKTHRLPGTGSASSAAVRGSTVVAVGTNNDGDDNRSWRSSDGGATWRAGGKPPKVKGDDDFNRELSDIIVRGRKFLAIGHAWTDEYEPTLYTTADARSWRLDATAAGSLDRDGNDYGEQLGASGDVAVTQEKGEFDVDRIWYRSGSRYRSSRTPLTDVTATSIWSVQQVVRTPRGWLASVNEYPNGRTRGHLWFSTTGRTWTEVAFPATEPGIATIYPNTVVMTGGHPLLVGSSRGRPAWWSATGQAPYRPQTLADQFGLRVSGATAAGSDVLVWGSILGGNSEVATVWRGTAAGSFVRTDAGTFGKAEDYGYSTIAQIRRTGKEWIAVGERSHNGDGNRSVLISVSSDGKRWRTESAARTFIPKDKAPDTRYAVTDLSGSGDHVRSANDVVAARGGPLMVGSSAEQGEPQATLWRPVERDGARRWQLERLPVKGYEESDMEWAQAAGDTIVVVGSVRKKGASSYLPYVWRSANGGRSFTGALLPMTGLDADHTSANLLLRTANAFVITGGSGKDVPKSVAWRSSDGKNWAALRLPVPAATPTDYSFVVDSAVDGADLVHLVRQANASGFGLRLVRQTIG